MSRHETKSNNRSLKLAELLDEEQPYKEFKRLQDPELNIDDDKIIQKIQGSLVGLAVGDALGASVEFRPNAYLKQHPVDDMQSGGTWGLQAGQWTDDTSMTLCLAASLIIKGKSDSYDQFVRYKRWYKNGYMSSTGTCFDIGKATRIAITNFETWQREVFTKSVKEGAIKGSFDDSKVESCFQRDKINLKFGPSDSAGNGSLMRLAPIPSFFFKSYDDVKKNIEEATALTHGDKRAIDACRFYAGLIWYALNGVPKERLLDPNFYHENLDMNLDAEVLEIIKSPYKNRKGYEDGIRGKGFVLNALEAALWAFHNDGGSFEKGVLDAINLGDDTDTTAAIYGQLAGAVYGINKIPDRWVKQLFQAEFIKTIAKGLYVKGKQLTSAQQKSDWSDESARRPDQTNANNTRDQDNKTKEAHTTRSNQPTSTHSTSHQNEQPNVGSPHIINE